MTYAEVMDHVAQGFEALGVFVLAAGTPVVLRAGRDSMAAVGTGKQAYTILRQALGGTLLLGLEILVAADLVRTIAVAPTLNNVLILGLIVLIRTFLSFSIDIEINGTLPWRQASATGAAAIRQASASMPPPKHT